MKSKKFEHARYRWKDMFSTQLNGHQNNKFSFLPYMQNLGTSFARFIHMFIWTKIRSLVEWRF
jgi:hypothetical protein